MRHFVPRLLCQTSAQKRRSRTTPYRTCSRLHIDALESRRMLAVTVTFTNGALEVDCDANADDIAVTFQEISGTDYLIVKDGATTIFDGTPSDQNVKTSDVLSIDVAGGDGNDTIDLSDVITTNGFAGLDGDVTVSGGGDNDSITGGGFGDVLVANSGNDTIYGGTGNDTLVSGTGDDRLMGESGDDLYFFQRSSATESLGSDTLTEGTGVDNDDADALIFSNYLEGVTVDLSSTSSQAVNPDLTITLSANDAFEAVAGSALADTITGNDRDNLLAGGGGNDTITGGDGADTILGEAGDDSIVGGAGNDILIGGTEDDNLTGGAGNDLYNFAQVGSEDLGSDTITEGTGGSNDSFDALDFSDNTSGVTINLSTITPQTVIPGQLTITLNANDAFENVAGSEFDDNITGNSRDNLITANGGNDSLNGSSGTNTLSGNIGDDTLRSGTGNDSLVGGAGDDVYSFIRSSTTQSLGSDTLTDRTGMDNDDGDALFFGLYLEGVTVDLSSTSAQAVNPDLTITLNANDNFEILAGSDLADSLTGNTRDNTLLGFGGNDSLIGGAGSDFYVFLDDPQGSDTITEAAAANPDTDQDTDSVVFEDADVAVTFNLSLITGQNWGDGTITLSDSAGIEFLVGSDQDDTLTGNTLDNFIWGKDGDDSISGGDGEDFLVGGLGADTIYGNAGGDILIAGDIDFGGDEFDAVVDIRNEWRGGNSYQDRVDNILAGAPDPSPIPSASQLDPGTTVIDDVDVDSLVGGAGDDWCLLDPDEDVSDCVGIEVETDIDV